MIIDPSKMLVSGAVSAMILIAGGLFLSATNPQLEVAQNPELLASSEPNNFDQTNQVEIISSDGFENSQSGVQNSPENAIIEAEAMMASLEEFSTNNNSDWSLENISDHAMEMRR